MITLKKKLIPHKWMDMMAARTALRCCQHTALMVRTPPKIEMLTEKDGQKK
jgi:hypothetical protein